MHTKAMGRRLNWISYTYDKSPLDNYVLIAVSIALWSDPIVQYLPPLASALAST